MSFISIPLFLMAIGHTIHATVQGPLVNKYADKRNKDMIPRIFSLLKIYEGLVINLGIYTYGNLRQWTGSYFVVSAVIVVSTSIGVVLGIYLHLLG
jgi:ABC-type phosphate transport system permease subunit